MLVKKEEMKKKKSMWKEDDAWVQHTQNAYGAFAHVAMQSGILKAVQMCGPMLMASILIQTVFAAQLLYNHWTDMVCTLSVCSRKCRATHLLPIADDVQVARRNSARKYAPFPPAYKSAPLSFF